MSESQLHKVYTWVFKALESRKQRIFQRIHLVRHLSTNSQRWRCPMMRHWWWLPVMTIPVGLWWLAMTIPCDDDTMRWWCVCGLLRYKKRRRGSRCGDIFWRISNLKRSELGPQTHFGAPSPSMNGPYNWFQNRKNGDNYSTYLPTLMGGNHSLGATFLGS